MKLNLKPMTLAVVSAAAFGMSAALAGGTAKDRTAGADASSASAGQTTLLIIDEPRFAELDRDRDQRLSKDEAGSLREQNWDTIDRDRDGYLTREELRYYHAQMTPGQDRSGMAPSRDRTTGQAASSGVTGAASVPVNPGAPTAGNPSDNASTAERTAEQLPSGPTTLGVTPDKAGGASSGASDNRGSGSTGGGAATASGGSDSTSGRTATDLPSGQTSLGVEADKSRSGAGGTVGMDQPSGAQGTASTPPAAVAIVIIDEPQFVRLDTDRDNRLSKEEVRAVSRIQESWGAFDKDGNGYLTREEINDYNRQLTPGQGATGTGTGR